MAITKSRLKELIDEGATVYLLKKNEIESIRLTDNHYIEGPLLILDIDPILPFYENEYFLTDLYEHKADAEWDLEFKNVEKRIKFVRPMLFRKVSEYIFKVNEEARTSLNHNIYVNYGFILNVSDDFTLRLSCKGEIIFEKPFNEENYTEACRLIKKLFMGVEKWN